MPTYTAGKAVGVFPGQSFVMFDGTETPTAGLKGAAFCRLPGVTPVQGQVFTVDFPSAVTSSSVQIQGANVDVDANYQTLQTISTQQGYYADAGEFRFYRPVLSAYVAGGMPVVAVNS